MHAGGNELEPPAGRFADRPHRPDDEAANGAAARDEADISAGFLIGALMLALEGRLIRRRSIGLGGT